MLAILHPTVFMDSFDPYRHGSDYSPSNRHQPRGFQRSQQVQSSSVPQQQQQQQQPQQQLPSFKEILSPPLHSAIDSTPQGTSSHLPSSENSATLSQGGSRAAGSSLPSPIYSQSNSMPDSFDDFSTRSSDPSFQLQSQQRNPSTWAATPQYTEMAATYSSQRPAYPSHGMTVPRPSPGLPPIRDIGQGPSKYSSPYETPYLTSNGPYPQIYNHSSSTQPDSHSYAQRRDSSAYYDANTRNYSHTYPPTGPQYGVGRELGGFTRTYPDYAGTHYPRPAYNDGFRYAGLPMNGTPSPIAPAGMIDPGDGRNRRRRGNLPKHITDILRQWFQDHLDHPYPSEEEKQMFIAQTGLTISQISNWFINARRRHLPAMKANRDSHKQEVESLHHAR